MYKRTGSTGGLLPLVEPTFPDVLRIADNSFEAAAASGVVAVVVLVLANMFRPVQYLLVGLAERPVYITAFVDRSARRAVKLSLGCNSKPCL
jgi:uncharacterized phosphosugar-binding protein